MLNKKIADMLNEQVNKELYSAYLYLDFANYYEDEGLDGFAHWYEIQAQEERDHALMLRRYLIDNSVRVTFGEIAKPDKEYKTHMCPLEAGLEPRKIRYVADCRNLSRRVRRKGFQNYAVLDWFVKEQGEEEKNADDLIKKMKLFGGDSKGLYMLNQELNAPRLHRARKRCGLT